MKQIVLLLAFSAGLLLVNGCKKKQADSNGGDSVAPAAANVSDVSNVVPRTDKAPNFSWRDSSGNLVDFAAYSSNVNVINFWATWCGPCKHELPDLIALQKEFAPKGVRIIGVSADVGANVADDVKSFAAEHGINYQVVIANDEMKEAFGNVNMLPTTFITDKEGKILETLVGARSKEQFAEAINSHMN